MGGYFFTTICIGTSRDQLFLYIKTSLEMWRRIGANPKQNKKYINTSTNTHRIYLHKTDITNTSRQGTFRFQLKHILSECQIQIDMPAEKRQAITMIYTLSFNLLEKSVSNIQRIFHLLETANSIFNFMHTPLKVNKRWRSKNNSKFAGS